MKDSSVEPTENSAEPTQDPAAGGVTPSVPDAAALEDLQKRAAKADENWDRLVRISADFENYKKRATREKQDAVRYANEALLEKLLPVLDNFEMALTAASSGQSAEGSQSVVEGVTMIQQQLKSVLTAAGLEEIDATGKPFDPNFHEALSQMPSADVPEGNVLHQLRKGYKLRDRLLRPASVVVATKQ